MIASARDAWISFDGSGSIVYATVAAATTTTTTGTSNAPLPFQALASVPMWTATLANLNDQFDTPALFTVTAGHMHPGIEDSFDLTSVVQKCPSCPYQNVGPANVQRWAAQNPNGVDMTLTVRVVMNQLKDPAAKMQATFTDTFVISGATVTGTVTPKVYTNSPVGPQGSTMHITAPGGIKSCTFATGGWAPNPIGYTLSTQSGAH